MTKTADLAKGESYEDITAGLGAIRAAADRAARATTEHSAALHRAANAMDVLRSAAEGAREEDDRDAGYGTVEIVLLVVVVVLALVGIYYLIKTN